MQASDAVLVTRPAGQADRLCAGLAAAGYRAVHQPLLAVTPIDPLDADQQGLIRALDGYEHCLFVSANAARFGLDCVFREWAEWPRSVQCYAVGDTTADVLRAAGIRVLTPGENMTSEGLLALPSLQGLAGQNVLIVKGEGGRNALRDALLGQGACVDELRCYRRSAPDLTPQALQGLLRRERVTRILVSSGEVLENLMALLHPAAGTPPDLSGLSLVVPSARVAEQARAAGWRDVAVATNASDDAMLSAMQQSMSAQGEHP